MRFYIFMILAISVLVASCKKENSTTGEKSSYTSPSVRTNDNEAKDIPKQTPSAKHDHESPPIDCPLRKQGINPHGMKPFDEVEKYIAFLERSDRSEWQRPDDIIKALKLTGTETVSDVGAGSGYFTFRLAKALPDGKVRAIDVEPEMIRHIHHKAISEGAKNIEVILATFSDPKVSEDTDLVFICDVLHHVQKRQAWLERIHKTLRPDAKLVLIEFAEGDLPQGPPETLKISKDKMVALAKKVGFRLIEDHSKILPYQHFLVFSSG
jgi:ubiquinone/menaquinone biosynthesis C-methylase UbiE